MSDNNDEVETALTVSAMLRHLPPTNAQSAGLVTPLTGYNAVSGEGAAPVDYLFMDEARQRGERGWSERLCTYTGAMYFTGKCVIVICNMYDHDLYMIYVWYLWYVWYDIVHDLCDRL